MLEKHGLSIKLIQNMQVAVEMLRAHISTFILLDLELDGAYSFLKTAVTTFYDPPPYIIAADIYPCSLAKADILNLGADACVDKPLDFEEVLAVINAVIRRAERLARPKPFHTAPPIERGTLRIDPQSHTVTLDGNEVVLTVKEFEILHLLASHEDNVLTKAQIYERIWGDDYEFASTSVSDMISSLRKKLGLDPKAGRYIQTVRGVGYRFVKPE